ncbi:MULTISPECIES: class I adenylate-forming enzyme family protein [Pseudomonas]|uniref:class I adenylate-forming enzyme family protein n=1 Tax=Pseudomonas TaxID=286 RepID=UPI00123BC3AA|nr:MULTISPECIES: class I adenylate-forming enzyme family protein [Pseudomonas]QIB51374.1 acyl--CoA ligase [Pseudomonas sp. OIL-1]
MQAPDEMINGRLASEILEALPARISHRPLQWAEETPDAEAIVDSEARWSYAELAQAIASTRQLLLDYGVRPGDRIMVVNENCRALVALIFAASELDVWCAVVSSRLSDNEIDAIAASCDPRRLIYTTATSPDARHHANRHGASYLKREDIGEIALGPLNEDAEPKPVVADPAAQVATMIFTSGTTGTPKGVMLTHRNMLSIASVASGLRGFSPADRVYAVLPISHVFGLNSVFLGSLYAGATLYLTERFDPSRLRQVLARENISVLQGVPAMFQRFLEHLNANQLELMAPNLRYISVGGAPLDPGVKHRIEAAFGLPLHNGYGLTEASPTISQTRMGEPLADTSCGRLLPLLEYRLQGDDGAEIPAGEVGELWIRGPNVMKGYYRRPKETAEVLLPDGWLNTGDLARVDGNDHLHIVGRTKELIIRSGFNVYPPDVEAVLTQHPDVTLSAVVGRAVPGNEEVIAYVQLVPGSTTSEDQIKAFAAERLAPYKRPARIIIMDDLPATPSGKILKGRLRQRIESE